MDSTNYGFRDINVSIRDEYIARILDDNIKKLNLELESKLNDGNNPFDRINDLYSQLNNINNTSFKEHYTKLIDEINMRYIEIRIRWKK